MKKGLIFILSAILLLSGCQASRVSRIEKGKPEVTKVGFGSYAERNNGVVRLTYAGIGLDKDNKISFLSINENDVELGNQKSTLLSKKELGNSYGLSLKSDKGDWKDQMEAFENYVVGNHMTKDELLEISLDSEGKPDNQELSVACELNLKNVLKTLKIALNKLNDVDGYSAAISQNMIQNASMNNGEVTLVFVVKNYFNKIDYIYFDQYNLNNDKEKIESERKNPEWLSQIEILENYMRKTEVSSFVNMQTYDKGDGIYNSLPMKNSDLYNKFNMNLGGFQDALAKIGN